MYSSKGQSLGLSSAFLLPPSPAMSFPRPQGWAQSLQDRERASQVESQRLRLGAPQKKERGCSVPPHLGMGRNGRREGRTCSLGTSPLSSDAGLQLGHTAQAFLQTALTSCGSWPQTPPTGPWARLNYVRPPFPAGCDTEKNASHVFFFHFPQSSDIKTDVRFRSEPQHLSASL